MEKLERVDGKRGEGKEEERKSSHLFDFILHSYELMIFISPLPPFFLSLSLFGPFILPSHPFFSLSSSLFIPFLAG